MNSSDPPTVILGPKYAEAVAYASALHAHQVRKSTNIPYISHHLAVSSLILEAEGDEEMAIAGLLHDGPEDQGGREVLNDIGSRFGPRVAHIVEGCTDSQIGTLFTLAFEPATFSNRRAHVYLDVQWRQALASSWG